MSDIVREITNKRQTLIELPEFGTGDTVEVHMKVKEGEKERIQQFKGVVTKVQGTGNTRSFTVRKMASGVGVERTFPVGSPNVSQVDLLARGQVRQSRLYYLRGLRGKKARIKSELVVQKKK